MTYDVLLLAEIVKHAPGVLESDPLRGMRGRYESTPAWARIDKFFYNHDSGKLHKVLPGQHHIQFAYNNPHKLHLNTFQQQQNSRRYEQEHEEEFPQTPHPSVLSNNTRISKYGQGSALTYELNHESYHPKHLEHSQNILAKMNAPMDANVYHIFGGDEGAKIIQSTVMDTVHAKSFRELDLTHQFRGFRESVSGDVMIGWTTPAGKDYIGHRDVGDAGNWEATHHAHLASEMGYKSDADAVQAGNLKWGVYNKDGKKQVYMHLLKGHKDATHHAIKLLGEHPDAHRVDIRHVFDKKIVLKGQPATYRGFWDESTHWGAPDAIQHLRSQVKESVDDLLSEVDIFMTLEARMGKEIPYAPLYHGTTADRVASIQQQGLIPQTQQGDPRGHPEKRVWLTTHPGAAQGFSGYGDNAGKVFKVDPSKAPDVAFRQSGGSKHLFVTRQVVPPGALESKIIGKNEIGGWWYNHAQKKLHDVSEDVGGGTNDHVGFMWAADNGTKVGLTSAEVHHLKRGYGLHLPEDHPDYGAGEWDDKVSAAAQKLSSLNTRVTYYKQAGKPHSVGVDTSGRDGDEGLRKGQEAIIALHNAGHTFHPESEVYWDHCVYPSSRSTLTGSPAGMKHAKLSEFMAANHHTDVQDKKYESVQESLESDHDSLFDHRARTGEDASEAGFSHYQKGLEKFYGAIKRKHYQVCKPSCRKHREMLQTLRLGGDRLDKINTDPGERRVHADIALQASHDVLKHLQLWHHITEAATNSFQILEITHLAEDQAEYSYYDHPSGIKWERGRFHHSSLRDYYDIPHGTPRGHFVVDHQKRATKVLPYFTHGSTVDIDDIHSRLRSEFGIPSFYSR